MLGHIKNHFAWKPTDDSVMGTGVGNPSVLAKTCIDLEIEALVFMVVVVMVSMMTVMTSVATHIGSHARARAAHAHVEVEHPIQ